MTGSTAQRLAHRRRLLVGRARAQRLQLTQDLHALAEGLRPSTLAARAWVAVRSQPGLALALAAGLWMLRRAGRGGARGGWVGRGLLAWRLWQSLRRRRPPGGDEAAGGGHPPKPR